MSKTPDLPNNGGIYIRKGSIDDAIAIRAIAESSGIDAWSVRQYRQEIPSKESVVLVAVDGETIVGFILGRIVPRNIAAAEAEIYNIAVTHDARRKGIGQMLLAGAVESFVSDCAESVWLEVRSSNSAAVQFYENNGFKTLTVRKNFYSNPIDDAFVMRLELPRSMQFVPS